MNSKKKNLTREKIRTSGASRLYVCDIVKNVFCVRSSNDKLTLTTCWYFFLALQVHETGLTIWQVMLSGFAYHTEVLFHFLCGLETEAPDTDDFFFSFCPCVLSKVLFMSFKWVFRLRDYIVVAYLSKSNRTLFAESVSLM